MSECKFDIHQIIPYVGDYCADWARSNDLGEWWFPSPEEWTMVYDWACDFGEWPEGCTQEDVEAAAKKYVCYKDPEPDPNFWSNLQKRYPMCNFK